MWVQRSAEQAQIRAERDAERARQALLEYCKLDTYAMVKIWQKLIEMVNNRTVMTQEAIDKLKNNIMFHLSLGSKELFHSNFLHWLSIINPTEFFTLMHDFAGVDNFWWEDAYYKDKKEGTHYEVRRESENFDLSIWINLKADKAIEEYKWVPVLVLENKMKSLASKEQLDGYVEKAYDRWGKRELKKWSEDCSPITFILLTLVEDKNEYEINYELESGSIWLTKTYNDLYSSLDKFRKNDNSLNDKIIDSYKEFIMAMYDLGNSWVVNDNREWSYILPKEELKNLRINDAHQKLCYSQIEKLLGKSVSKLETGIGFSNGSGLVEVSVNAGDDLKFKIQVQGNKYCRVIDFKNGDAVAEAENLDLWKKFFCFKNAPTHKFPFDAEDIMPSNNNKAISKAKSCSKFNYYTQSFAYQYVEIPTDKTVANVIEAIVNDINNFSTELSKI